MQKAAALMKINFVLEVARKDKRFLTDLARQPAKTLAESGIDLTANETLAVLDVLHNTEHSLFAKFLGEPRKVWKALAPKKSKA